MIPALQQIGRIVLAAGRIAGRWLRFALAILLLWPMLIVCTGMLPHQYALVLTPIAALTPLVALVIFLFVFADPLVWAALAAGYLTSRGRNFLGAIVTIIAGELAAGPYFALVPLSVDRALAPALVVSIIAFLLAYKVPELRMALGIQVIILTIIFSLGGRTAAKKMAEEIKIPQVQAESTESVTANSNSWARPDGCKDRWESEAKGIGNHVNEEDIKSFVIDPAFEDRLGQKPVLCYNEAQTPPSVWPQWEFEFVADDDTNCRAWFFPTWGDPPVGPVGPNDFPKHWHTMAGQTTFNVATTCQLRVFRFPG